MTMEYDSEVEEATNWSSCDDETEIDVFLRVTPLLTFSSGSEATIQAGGVGSELQKPVNLEKVYSTHSGHSHKQTNWLSSNDNVEKLESKKARAKKFKLDGSEEVNAALPVSPESSPTTGRNHRMALIRSLSSSAPTAPKDVPPKRTRRLSDPTVPSEKGLVKSFERQTSLKKLRPYLKRKAVSPLHLLGKVAASTGCKHSNNDVTQNKEPKGNKVRLAKRLYPSFNKANEQLSQKERRGSDPSGVPSKEDRPSLVNDYETMINDFSNQIQDLAFNLENLTTTDHTRSELAVSGNMKTNRRHVCEQDVMDNGTGHFFKDDDIRLQEMLEQVLRSHLVTMDDYSPTSCDQASRSIGKIITRLLGGGHRQKRPCDGQRKLACLVYIGAIRDSGIKMAAQALWCPDEDTFAVASFRNESVYGFAVVIATPAF
jgi:hypothetical protein